MNDAQKTGPRDVFSHLLAVIFLYVSIFSFGAIIFGFIDYHFPDYLSGNYGAYASDFLRWPLAVLVIVFPCYVWLTYYLQKELVINPEKRELRTRKWLLYFTLFAATIAIVIDIIMVLYQYLSGELSVHFILRVLTVLAIAGSVFVYYLWTLRKDIPALHHSGMRFFVYGVLAVVAVSIVYGFYLAGSPQSQRARRFDDQRVNDLTIIQSQVKNYWQAKQKVPQSLDDLRDPISGFIIPQDPETGAAYEYRAIGDKEFELCATFLTNSTSDQTSAVKPMPVGVDENWTHGAGKTCFNRVIDPDRYPPFKKLIN